MPFCPRHVADHEKVGRYGNRPYIDCRRLLNASGGTADFPTAGHSQRARLPSRSTINTEHPVVAARSLQVQIPTTSATDAYRSVAVYSGSIWQRAGISWQSIPCTVRATEIQEPVRWRISQAAKAQVQTSSSLTGMGAFLVIASQNGHATLPIRRG